MKTTTIETSRSATLFATLFAKFRSAAFAAPVLAGLALAGCDPAADTNPATERAGSTTLTGMASAPAGKTLPAAEIALSWFVPNDKGGASTTTIVSHVVPVTDGKFSIVLDKAPESRVMKIKDGGSVALGGVTAFEAGFAKAGGSLAMSAPQVDEATMKATNEPWSKRMGAADAIVIHLDRDLPDAHPIKQIFGTTKAGFHQIRLAFLSPEAGARQTAACLEVFSKEACGDIGQLGFEPVPGGAAAPLDIALAEPGTVE